MVAWQRLCAENPHETALEEGVGARLRGQPPHEVPKIHGASGPLKTPKIWRKLRSIGGLGLILESLRYFPPLQGVQRVEQCLCTESRQAIVEGPSVILTDDGGLPLQ